MQLALEIVGSVILGFVLLVVILRFYNTYVRRGGNVRALSRWAKEVEFSNDQLTVMRSLWQAYKLGKVPTRDSTAMLSPAEMADLMKKCEVDFVPRRYRLKDEEPQRRKFIAELCSRGMDEIQAQIVTAMKFARLGPANDS